LLSRGESKPGSQQLSFFFYFFIKMDDLDALLDLEGAAFGDDDEGVFDDDDVGVGGPSIKAGKERRGSEKRDSGKYSPDCRRRRLEKRWRDSLSFCFSNSPSFFEQLLLLKSALWERPTSMSQHQLGP